MCDAEVMTGVDLEQNKTTKCIWDIKLRYDDTLLLPLCILDWTSRGFANTIPSGFVIKLILKLSIARKMLCNATFAIVLPIICTLNRC